MELQLRIDWFDLLAVQGTLKSLLQHHSPLLFNTLSRFVTAFLPRSKCLLISWLQSTFAVILEPNKIHIIFDK